MRFKISFTKSIEKVPNTITNEIVYKFFHKVLGTNEYHNVRGNYVLSNLNGSKLDKELNMFDFHNPHFYISSSDNNLLINFITKLKSTDTLGYGMKYKKYEVINDKLFLSKDYVFNQFYTLTPLLILDGEDNIILNTDNVNELKTKISVKKFNDVEFSKFLTDKTKNMLSKITDEKYDDLKISVVNNQNNKVKKIYFNKYKKSYFATNCLLSINANPKITELLYNIGLGNSTGCGYGFLVPRFNIKDYR